MWSLRRLFYINSGVTIAAIVLLVVTPAEVTYPVRELEVLALMAGALVMAWINWHFTERLSKPWQQLTAAVSQIDTPDSSQRLQDLGDKHNEVGELAAAFNQMLVRLEDERSEAARKAIGAQEAERARVSSELHDEVGQRLTALLLHLKALGTQMPEHQEQLEEFAESVRATLDEVRGISARLRPGVLNELGLRPAIESLVREFDRSSKVAVSAEVEGDLGLTHEQELVIYRVVQESLTNVMRHADATEASVRLHRGPDGVVATIRDDGNGAGGAPGVGRSGMEERARLVEGSLVVQSEPGIGTTVVLTVPLTDARASDSAQASENQRNGVS